MSLNTGLTFSINYSYFRLYSDLYSTLSILNKVSLITYKYCYNMRDDCKLNRLID